VGALVGLVAVFNAAAVHAVTPGSDAASLVLEAQSVIGGHVLLHGWALSLDSFWTVEVPFYAAASVVTGMVPALLSLVPAIVGGLVALFGVLIGRDGRARPAALAGAVTVVALLVFPTHALAMFFLVGGVHLGAVLGALVAFYALRRGRWDIGVVVAVVVLTAGMLGDLQEVAYGTAPVLLAGLVAMARRRSVGAGLPAVFAAGAAGSLTIVVRLVAQAIGTFSIGTPNAIATPGQMVRNVGYLFRLGAEMLGLRSTIFGTGGVPTWLQEVHAIGALLVLTCVIVAVIRMVAGLITRPRSAAAVAAAAGEAGSGAASTAGAAGGRAARVSGDEMQTPWWQSEPGAWRLDDLLTMACVTSAISYLLLAVMYVSSYSRYLTATVVFSIVLAARVVARAWPRLEPVALKRAVAGLAAVVAMCFAVGFGFTLTAPAPKQPVAPLATWLVTHHLTSGVGPYTVASITTVQSKDQVAVRPVVAAPSGRLVRYDRESDAAWYKGARFHFVVYAPAAPFGKVNAKSATATFGRPTRSYTVGRYRVLVWRRPFTVSPKHGYGS